MRRAVVLALISAIAACGGGEGIQLEVVLGDVNATSVELFVATKHCDACAEGIGAPGDNAKLAPNDVYFRDGVSQRYWGDLVGGMAMFHLIPGGDLTYVKSAIAVAYVADAAAENGRRIVGVATFTSFDTAAGPERRQARLRPAMARASRPTKDAAGEFVQVWGADDNACVVVERRTGADSATYTTYVQEGDPDCDGFLANECEPYIAAFKGDIPTTIKDATCAKTFQPNQSLEPVCQLGGGCADGSPSCAPAPICAPGFVCQCGLDAPVCLANQIKTSYPHFDCTISVNIGGGGYCADGTTLELPRMSPNNDACSLVEFLNITANPGPGTLRDPRETLEFRNGAKFTGVLGSPCTTTLTGVNAPTLPAGPPSTEYAAAVFTAVNTYQLVIPIRMTFVSVSDCAVAPHGCMLVTEDPTTGVEDPMFACTAYPQPVISP